MSPSIPPLPPLSLDQPSPLIYAYEPDKAIVIHRQTIITQRQFLRDLHRLAARLPDAGYAFNLCEDRYYFLLTFCALLLKGTVNLLPPSRQISTLRDIAVDFPGAYCLFDKSQDCEIESRAIEDVLGGSVGDDESLPEIGAQQIAAIAFTSGSTGKPKPNAKAWGTLAATARLLGERLIASIPNPVIVATVPSQHMYGLETTLFMALQAGAIMHSAKPFFPADVEQVLASLPGSGILVSAPVHLRALVNADLSMPRLAGIISATAPLDADIARRSEAVFDTQLWEIYGCTEAGSMATRRSTHGDTWQLLDGFVFEQTEAGVIARGPHLSEEAPLQDLIELKADDQFLLRGRNTDMINVAGKRTSLANLTLQLLRIEGVRDGVVFLPPQEQTETRPVALVVSDLPEKQILAALANLIDAAFLPRPLRKVESLPRNETGKLTVGALHGLWNQIQGNK